MLDWENFPGIRPSHEPLPLPTILGFLETHFDLRARLAYAHRATLSADWEGRLREQGFEIRLLDGLVDPNDKKNSLDLCLAMDAVRLAYTEEVDGFALLVAGDKDFAVVAAFVRHRLERQVLAFGSLYCPNHSLANQVDRYFLVEQQDDWARQLIHGTGRYLPRRVPDSVRRSAERQRPYVVAGLAELGPDVPRRLGQIIPAIRQRHPDFEKRSGMRLSTLLEALGCQLDADRQHVLHWPPDLVDAARAHSETRWALLDAKLQHFTDRGRLERLCGAIRSGFDHLGLAARYPLPLSVLHGAMRQVVPEFAALLSKRLRLWHALEDLGFELSADHTVIVAPRSELARRIAWEARLARQLDLFGGDDEASSGATMAAPRAPVFSLSERSIALAEEALAERVRLRQLALGPHFDGLRGPLQRALPFATAASLAPSAPKPPPRRGAP